MTSNAEIVSRFASSLDAEDYPTTRSLLSEDCRYESPDGLLVGPAAIVESYRGHGDSARDRFDSIEYSHEITPLDGGWYQIEFIDELFAGTKAHMFRCHQRVLIDDRLVVRIVHVEIPGQRESLNAFLQTLE